MCNSEPEFSCKLNPWKLSTGELARTSRAKLCCWNWKGSFTEFTEHFWSPSHVEHLASKLTGSSLWTQTDNSFLSLEKLCIYRKKLILVQRTAAVQHAATGRIRECRGDFVGDFVAKCHQILVRRI